MKDTTVNVKYEIVSGYGRVELAERVNEWIAFGWTVSGGVAVEPAAGGYAAIYSQAMIFVQKPTTEKTDEP